MISPTMTNTLRKTTVYRWLSSLRRAIKVRPPVGKIDFGSLRKLRPVSTEFGYDRGLPVDRFYIEQFLEKNQSSIKGRVLEIGDNSYTRQFGGDAVTESEVLHVTEGNVMATYVGDLTNAESVPSLHFDCIILTQTLQFIFELPEAASTLHRILKPGGVLLLTVPGISKIPQDQWGDLCCWSFTRKSVFELFQSVFPRELVVVESSGNVLSAVAFLHGLATEELDESELNYHDPLYQVLISMKAVKGPVGPQSETHWQSVKGHSL